MQIIHYLSQQVALWWCLQLLFCYGAVLLMLRLFGAWGVAVLMGVMMIAANIQVLKVFEMPVLHDVLPLGTALMATNYLAADILAEYYGKDMAKKAINLAVAAFVLMCVAMYFTIYFPSVNHHDELKAGIVGQSSVQHALKVLFSPAPKLFLSSIVSFWLSQRLEVFIFCAIKKSLGDKYLWLRNNVSTWIAALCDNIIFSLLVWRLFTGTPVPWGVLITGYIFGTYLLRILMAILDTPMIYLAKLFKPKHT